MAAAAKTVVRAAYDLVVVGAGSGGLEAAYNAAALYKAKVAVVDVQKSHGPPFFSALGGTCVNVGCVPKKLLVTGALYQEHFKDAKGFGWDIDADKIAHSWPALIAAKNKAVGGINESYTEMFATTPGLEFVMGWGSLRDKNTVVVSADRHDPSSATHELSAKYVLLATGGWPSVPKFPGSEHVITSNEAFYLPEAPKRTLIVGGGFIAVEFASIFHSFQPPTATGSGVTLCYRGDLFLRGFDRAVREELRDQMSARGIRLRFNDNPSSIAKNADGSLTVVFSSGRDPLTVDVVMYATGRTPNVATLNLEAVGVRTNKDGSIVVDPFSRTSVDNIFAIGDVTNRMQLTPVAINEGANFADTVFGNAPKATSHTNVPAAVFAIPQIGTVGLTEEEAAQAFGLVGVYQSRFTPLMHKLTGAAHKGFLCKVITDHTTNVVVGVHICGSDAAEIIQGVGIAVKMGARIQDFYGTIGVHPTSAEELCSMRKPAYYVVNGTKVEELFPTAAAPAATSSL